MISFLSMVVMLLGFALMVLAIAKDYQERNYKAKDE